MAVSTIRYTRAGRMQFQSLFECVGEIEALWNPNSVNSNSFFAEDITCPGAQFGDMVLVSFEADIQDLQFTAHVASAGVVSLHLSNPTAGAVDLAENHIHVIVLRPIHHHS